ncbi:NUDIX domain-containing protein [Paenibacillus sp. sptzw28]|uniref:NUDIX domain-containing protein n=1 Tax=Paenibacillus sp. sptzw28 TaxID=715179 RepID=UPI001C6DF011|nr:NUDIX domain-containing protein [Paenibacillus sp. sptzw28]QYR23141.1 NUDIX domain-containing protein [Paenibacillus sp. sptzw28]
MEKVKAVLMMSIRQTMSTGGVLIKDGKVLLVRVNYGTNKGQWMIPGGFVGEGESLEQAVTREIREETGLDTIPHSILGIRCGVIQIEKRYETSIYVVFQMDYVSGIPKAMDVNEIADLQFAPIPSALSNPEVISLSKELIRVAVKSDKELLKLDKEITTNTPYKSYDVYTK